MGGWEAVSRTGLMPMPNKSPTYREEDVFGLFHRSMLSIYPGIDLDSLQRLLKEGLGCFSKEHLVCQIVEHEDCSDESLVR